MADIPPYPQQPPASPGLPPQGPPPGYAWPQQPAHWGQAGAPPYGVPPPPPPPEGWMAHQPTSGKAVASLVCALGGLVLGFFCGVGALAIPVGLVLGILGIVETGRNGKRSGRGLAIAGTIVSTLALAGAVVAAAYFVSAFGESATEMHEVQGANADADIQLIATRLQAYYRQNHNSLGPGGPWLSMRGNAAEAPAPTPAHNGVDEYTGMPRVNEPLSIRHLVGESELRAMPRQVDKYKLTVTGPASARLEITDWSGETLRDIDFSDVGKKQWTQRFP